jgi:methylthioribose-1-phosphate isomerase
MESGACAGRGTGNGECMKVQGRSWRTVWQPGDDPEAVWIIDQNRLPWEFAVVRLTGVEDVADAIVEMRVRGAGCIGATAAWGMWLAAREAWRGGTFQREIFLRAADRLKATRPTAVNLAWAVDRMVAVAGSGDGGVERARVEAQAISDVDAAACAAIGRHGLGVLRDLADAKPPGGVLNVLTHCNAGWLAFVDHGSALAPVYAAAEAGVAVHVWVDETRPRHQGSRLTAWELGQQGIAHTIVADNAGAQLMQEGLVDLVITGADRVARNGDVANKVGTFLKALAARHFGLPFYVAMPASTLDGGLEAGVGCIPIEERGADEVLWVAGPDEDGVERRVRVASPGSGAANPAFDVTPAGLVTAFITERGVCVPEELALRLS